MYDTDELTGEPLEGEESLAALSAFADGFATACALWPELVRSKNKAVQAALVGIMRYSSKDNAEDESAEENETETILRDIETDVAFANLDEALADLQACVQEIAEVTRKSEIRPQSDSSRNRKH